MTEAASLNFGPAWLRDSFTSNTAGEGPPGSASGGGTSNHSSQQNNSGWDIASSRSSHGHGRSNNSQQTSQSNFQMNLHVEGQLSTGASAMLSAMKLAEYRYGKEEMLGLYPVALVQDTPSSNSSTLLDADILEAMETTSLLVPDRRALPPLNLMGAASEDEQRAWSRGANSDTSLRLYSKQKDMSRVIEDGMAGRGRMDAGPSLRGDHRGGLPERGRGRGVGRGGSINTGGPFFDRHRSDDPMLDDALAGSRASNGGRGIGSSDIGSNDGGRPFGGGRGSRAFDRSLSSGGNWYADRSGSNGPSTAGIIGPGTTDESVNNGSLSPRKGYTRAPFDDWRKPTDREEDGDGGGWRNSGTGPSGRRWNAPASSGANSGTGASQGWRTSDDGYRGGAKYEKDFVNGGGRWREDGPNDPYFPRSRGGAFSSGNRGAFSNNSFSRQRSRQDSDLPEWALDDDATGGALGAAGGTFDSSGKFRAPSSESPPLQQSRDNTSPTTSPSSARKPLKLKIRSDRKPGDDTLCSQFTDKTSDEFLPQSMSNTNVAKDNFFEDVTSSHNANEDDLEKPVGRGRGRGRQRQDLRLLHGQMGPDYLKKQHNEKNHLDDDEDRFEDEEVDVDDLPPDVRKNTLQQREQQKKREDSKRQQNREVISSANEKHLQPENRFPVASTKESSHTKHQSISHEMDDALVDSLVDRLVNDDESSTSTMPLVSEQQSHNSPNTSPTSVPSALKNSNRIRQQSQETVLPGGGLVPSDQTRNNQNIQKQETVWYYLDPQGNRQGPFSNSDMLDWFKAGYFPTELMLRRSIDKRFIQLIEMTKLYERVPFAPGPWPNIPPPLEDIEELEKQKQDAEKRQREQHNAIFQQLQQQAILQQQLQLQQQRLFAIQQQHQGPDKAAIEQHLAGQAAATAQAIQQQQQLMQKMMQNMSLFQQQQHSQNPILAQQLLKEQLQSSVSPSLRAPGNQNELQGSEIGAMLGSKQQTLQQQSEIQPFSRQQLPSSSQPEQHTQSTLGGFGLGLSSPLLKTHHVGEGSPDGNQPRSPQPQQPALGGLLGGQQGAMPNLNDGGYDPIKSLLNQLQQSDQPSAASQVSSIPSQSVGLSVNEDHRTIPGDKTETSKLSGTTATDSPHMGRSIWDMPAAAVAAPPTSNPALTREQQEHQLLHQQQQLLLQQQQQNEEENISRGGWDQVRSGLADEKPLQNHHEYKNKKHESQQPWPSQEQDISRLVSQNSQLTGSEYTNHPPLSSTATVQATLQDYENDSSHETRNISTIDSFRTETTNDNIDSNLNKNDFITSNSNNVVYKPKDNKKDKREKGKKEGRKNEKVISNTTNPQEYISSENYIPGMEGAIKPEVPITATKSVEEEQQQRAQADALYRLQIEQQQMLERERALTEEKAAKQRQESLQSAVKLAPWAKKSGGHSTNINEQGIHHSGMTSNTYHTPEENSLSLAEIQRLEEERERERKIQKEIEDQQLREHRMKHEQEETRRNQGKGMNWANTAAVGNNNGPSNGGKSLAEILAEEESEERKRQERERQQKKERQKEMGLAQASVWGSASSNLSWASKAASIGVATPAVNITNSAATPQPKSKQNHQGSSSSLVTSSPAPWSSAVNTNNGSGGFWEDATPPPGLDSNTISQSNKNKKKANGKEVQKNTMKTAKEDAKVAQIFRENSAKNTPRQNEFEAWCSLALANLNAQVDIPTFMAFLKDIESPYEVNDYVKNYIGDGKGPKNFAKEYLERRSKYKNSLKCAPHNVEDDLLTPAQAINPNRESENDGWVGAGTSGGTGSYGATNKTKKKGKGPGKGSKFGDASHLLGFSVASERVNAGDIDVPQ